MTNYNPNAATTVGEETFFTEQGSSLIAGGSAAAVSFDSTVTQTVDTISAYLDSVTVDPVDLLMEVYTAGAETLADTDVTTSTFRPTDDLQIGGNDSESQKWLTEALGTTNLFNSINEATLDVTDFIAYVGTSAGRKRYRFTVDTGGADWPANQRVIGGRVKLVANREEVSGRLEISYFDGSNTYRLGRVTVQKGRREVSVNWPEYNPATRLPWTRAEIQALDTGGGSAIQIRPMSVNRQKVLRVHQAWLELDWVTENRLAVGRERVNSADALTWVSFTLQVPNSGADNWAKANSVSYTVLLRRIAGIGNASWRHLTEPGPMAQALGRPTAGAINPAPSYVPTMGRGGFVSSMGDPVAGRAMAFLMRTTAAAESVDGQPYHALTTLDSTYVASTQSIGQQFLAASTMSPGLIRFGLRAVYSNLDGTYRLATAAEIATMEAVTVKMRRNVGADSTESNDTDTGSTETLTPADILAVDEQADGWRLIEREFATAPTITSGNTYYSFISSTQLTAFTGEGLMWHVLGYQTGDETPSHDGGTGSGIQFTPPSTFTEVPNDLPVTVSVQPAALADFDAVPEPQATGADGLGCTVQYVDRVRLGHDGTALADADFARFEIERLAPDDVTWEPIFWNADPGAFIVHDWEGRLGRSESYRARQVRAGDFIGGTWVGVDAARATVAAYGAEVKIASNHARGAVAYEREPEYVNEHPQAVDVVARSGADGRYVFAQSEDQGEDYTLPLILFAGDDEAAGPADPGRPVVAALKAFLRSDVPHFAVCDADGGRDYGFARLVRDSRAEDESLYLASVEVVETQFAPTPYDAPIYDPDADFSPIAAALANVNLAQFTVLAVGDSVTEGHAGSTILGRYINVAAQALRNLYPTVALGNIGGIGYLPVVHGALVTLDNTPATAGITSTGQRGFGYRAANVNTAGTSTVTYTGVIGTSLRVYYATVAGGGSLSVTVDGGAPTVISTGSGVSSFHDDYTAVSTGGAVGSSHTVVITRSGAGGFAPSFCGIHVFDGDETKGVQFVDAARSGVKAGDIVGGATGGSTLVSDLEDWVANAEPALLAIALGYNEYIANTNPSVYKTNMGTVIDNFRLGDPSVPLLLVALPTPSDSATAAYPWPNYVEVMYELADEYDLAYVADLTDPDVVPQPGTAAAVGLYADTLHPTATGHARIGTALADIIDAL